MTDTPHKLVISLSHSTPRDERVQSIPLTAEDYAQRERGAADSERIAWVMLRAERNARLAASDFTQIPGAPLTTTQSSAWATYRQALRDMPASLVSPRNPPWPNPPTPEVPR